MGSYSGKEEVPDVKAVSEHNVVLKLSNSFWHYKGFERMYFYQYIRT